MAKIIKVSKKQKKISSNRIVVDYGDFADLVFLARINKETGVDELLEDNIVEIMKPFIVTKRYPEYEGMEFEDLQKLNLPNKEGFVLHDGKDRVKVKFPDYCRLHSIITNITARDIWRTLSTGADLSETLENVPDEFDNWVRKKIDFLNSEFSRVLTEINVAYRNVIAELSVGYTKKDFALKNVELNKSSFLRGMVFARHEGKNVDTEIWKSIYPGHEKPFRDNEEESE